MKNGCFQKWLAVTGFVFILGVCHGRSEVIQSPGPISIYVCDARGTVLPDVNVHVGGRYGTTDANGLAVLDGVPAGAYRLTIEQPAYDRYTEDVVIPSGRRDALKVQLQPSVSVPFVGGYLRMNHAKRRCPVPN